MHVDADTLTRFLGWGDTIVVNGKIKGFGRCGSEGSKGHKHVEDLPDPLTCMQ